MLTSMPIVFSLIVVGAMIFALVDIIRREEWQVRNLPKTMWIIIVVLLPLIGTVLWFTLGRVYADHPHRQRETRSAMPAPAPTTRPQQRSTEQQLADLEREIEEDRLRAERDRRRREQAGSAEG